MAVESDLVPGPSLPESNFAMTPDANAMTETLMSSLGLDRPETGDDAVVPFTLDKLDTRGRSVRLGDALDTILSRHDYPAPVARLLGEAVVLASLIGSSLKFDGRFIMQTQTDGPVNLIVVDFDAPDGIRGYARFDRDALVKAAEEGKTRPGELLGKGHLAMTIDQGPHTERYQGIVALEGNSLEEVAHTYFMQSEQIPTMVRLAVAEFIAEGRSPPPLARRRRADPASARAWPGGDGGPAGRRQFRQSAHRRSRFRGARRLERGQGAADDAGRRGTGRSRPVARAAAVPALPRNRRAGVLARPALVERCTCSADRIEDMLATSFTKEDREEMAVDGEIEVVCEFCSTAYHFNPHQFDAEH